MLSVDNFYKVIQVQIICPRKNVKLADILSYKSLYKYRIYLNKDVYHSMLYKCVDTDIWYAIKFSTQYDAISGYVELYIPIKVSVGDYLCIVDEFPTKEDIWNLLSTVETNDIKLIESITNML